MTSAVFPICWTRANTSPPMPAATPNVLVFCMLICGAAARHRSSGALERIAARGELTWGADEQGGEPYVFEDARRGGALVGFEVDLAETLARALGVRARFVQNDWTTLIPSLERGTFDIALNGIEVTPALAARVAFSRPYLPVHRTPGRAPGRHARARSGVDREAAGRDAGGQPGVAARQGRRRRCRPVRRRRRTVRRSRARAASTPCCWTTSSSRATRPATRRWRWWPTSPRAATRSRCARRTEACAWRSIARWTS